MTTKEMKVLINKAIKAGMDAGNKISSTSDKKGYSWVIIKPQKKNPDQEDFIKYLLKEKIVEEDIIYGGVRYLVTQFKDSCSRKVAFGNAFRDVLKEAGFLAIAMSR